MAHEILADAGFANIHAELEQFTVKARCSPKRILATPPTDQFSNVFRNRRPPRLAATDFPGPEQAEAPAVPGNGTVFGFTMSKAERQPLRTPHSQTHRSRSGGASLGRF